MPPKKTVLIIDDSRTIRELLKLHLSNAGYQVVVMEDAVAGGHQLLKSRPDLVIVDADMPYMTGYEFVQALKADPGTKSIPVIFLTGDGKGPEQARKLGAAGYLVKPVLADRLLDVVAMNLR